jgi:hypothetical protein
MAIQQIGNRQPDGDVFGVTSTDKIGFYGTTPVVQPANAAQTFPTVPPVAGTLLSVQSVSVTPSSTAANTCAAQALTVTGSPTASTDYIIHNKITSQAGLGVANVLGGTTASTIVVNYVNLTGSPITATAQAQTWATVQNVAKTVTLSPAAVAANSTVEQVFTVTGVSPTGIVHVTKPTNQAGLGIVGFRAVANNQLGITFVNATAATITPTASESYSYVQFEPPGVPVTSSIIIIGANIGGSPSAVNATSAAEQAISVAGSCLTTDICSGAIMKPTAQANISLGGVRISAAGVFGVTFNNPTGTTTTPTASEVYIIPLMRTVNVAPITVYSVSFAPGSVAANTTAAQAFTVTGITASQLVWVNKPTPTPGIGIANTRVSAAGVVEVTYSNSSSAAITPPTETYLVAAVTAPPAAGSYIAQIMAVQTSPMTVALRNAMTSLGLIGGS